MWEECWVTNLDQALVARIPDVEVLVGRGDILIHCLSECKVATPVADGMNECDRDPIDVPDRH